MLGWQYTVTLSGSVPSLAAVSLTMTGVATRRVCVDMGGAERFVRNVEQILDGGKTQALQQDGECWRLVDGRSKVRRLSYQYDLWAAAERFSSADLVERSGESLTFSDEAVLLRPDQLPSQSPSAPIEVEFIVQSGVRVSAPWEKLPGPGIRYRLDAAQYDGGSYITVGRFRTLDPIRLANTLVEIELVGSPRASDGTLRTWIEQSVRLSAGFYRELMPSPLHIVLVAVPGRRDLGIFGTVLRPLRPSLVIYFGGEAEQLSLHDDWVSTHEVFHVGNPMLRRKMPWFVEGFTTYYADVLRVRGGALSSEEAWSELWESMQRNCQPKGTSLATESEQLRQTFHYPRVYWGGACLALLLDVEIRIRSHGKRSLDDAMRELRARSLTGRLDEEAVIAGLGRDITPALVRRYLNEQKALPLTETLRSIGVEPLGPSRVRLRDEAPQASIRRAMF